VEGLVYELTGPQELQLLDAYEGSLYERADVHLETAKGTMSAMAYVVRPDFLTHLSEEEWSLSVFIRKHAHRFRVDWE
jgi:gamma-glutamylcyclotransferase (GGCT)/AIG2-like uncharacterized protein YtfP